MVSIYEAGALWGKDYLVYGHDEWNGDGWEASKDNRTYDPARSFFEQWADLHKAVPRMGLIVLANENCDFTTGTAYSKNCYLTNSSEYCEDCYYGKLLQKCRNCVDCSYIYDSERCYDCVGVYDSYGCTSLAFSKNCSDCHFSTNLLGCKNCILCSNLRQKEFHVRNKPVSKEEYQKTLLSFQNSHTAHEALTKEWHEIERSRVHRFANIVNCEACTGDEIENSKHCTECFDLTDSQDCLHAYVGVAIKDTQHSSNMYMKVELCYDILGAIEVYHGAYCLFCFYSQDLLYSEYCQHCKDCFGCVGLKHKRYCIFNKQYTKEEYEKLVPEIIDAMRRRGEWGEYFPAKNAPFGYNETLANEYFPLTKEEAIAKGFLWRDLTDRMPDVAKVIPAAQLPDSITDIPDDVLNWAIRCEKTDRPFRIIKQELQFCRDMNLPLPRLHPDVRYDDRLAWRNPRKLWNRACMKCQKGIQTSYAPDRPETVYCEECYLKEVY